MSPLKLAPYSTKTLCATDNICFQMQPCDKGWIINLHGERLGYTIKSKAGWKIEGYPDKWQIETIEKAQRLLDMHFAWETK